MISLFCVQSRVSGDRCQRQAHFPREEELEKKIGFLPEQVVCWCVHIWQAGFRSLPRVWPGQFEVVIETSGKGSTAALQRDGFGCLWTHKTWRGGGGEQLASRSWRGQGWGWAEGGHSSWLDIHNQAVQEESQLSGWLQVQADISSLYSVWPYQALSTPDCSFPPSSSVSWEGVPAVVVVKKWEGGSESETGRDYGEGGEKTKMGGCPSIENLLSLEILTFCETRKWHTSPIRKI